MQLKVFLKLEKPENSSLFWANIYKKPKKTLKTQKTHWAGFCS
jgi:hypothetical protein